MAYFLFDQICPKTAFALFGLIDTHTYGLRIPANRRAAHKPPGVVRYTTAQPAYLRESAIPRGFTQAPQSLP
jgi:hypothetical protein